MIRKFKKEEIYLLYPLRIVSFQYTLSFNIFLIFQQNYAILGPEKLQKR